MGPQVRVLGRRGPQIRVLGRRGPQIRVLGRRGPQIRVWVGRVRRSGFKLGGVYR